MEGQISSLGAQLVVVGNGKPEHAADFRKEQKLTFPLLVDPDMIAYRAAGLKRGIKDAVNLRMLGHGVRALRKGFRQRRLQGDPWQLGGVFVIAPSGEILYKQISREAGDHPEASEILGALGASKSL